MTNLPKEIFKMFQDVMRNKILIADFEEWVYKSKTLELFFSNELYLKFISFNYKTANYYDLRDLLSEYIDLGEIETNRILTLLKKVRNRVGEIKELEAELEREKEMGYDFLDRVRFPYSDYKDDEYNFSWQTLTMEQKAKVIDYHFLLFNLETELLIRSIEDGVIKIHHEFVIDKYEGFVTIDDRDKVYKLGLHQLKKEVFIEQWKIK